MARRFNKKSKRKHTTKVRYKDRGDGEFAPTKLLSKKVSLTEEYEKVATAHFCFKYRKMPNEIVVTIIK